VRMLDLEKTAVRVKPSDRATITGHRLSLLRRLPI
jgi:hypothetical protein